MGTHLLLVVGAASVATAFVILFLAAVMGSGTVTGVARSLAMIETPLESQEVARNEVPAIDRVILPFLSGTKGLALRLSPAGTSDRLARLLDLAGNPPAWTVERLLGFKGAGLIIGGFLGAFYGGLSLKGVLFCALGADRKSVV